MVDDTDNELAPLTNPDAGARISAAALATPGEAPAKAKAKAKPKAATAGKSKTLFGGSDLVPDISGRSNTAGTSRRFRYWVGITASCPVNGIDLAGISFPKVNEQIVPDPNRTGRKRRRLVAGAIVWLTADKIRLMRERLPRTVVRFLDEGAVKDEAGTGENIGDVAQRPRRGQIITIPTDKELTDRRARGKVARPYVPDEKRDVPAARFMFAVLCEDQDKPEQGEFYPDPLEITGLEWPDELAELDKLLR